MTLDIIATMLEKKLTGVTEVEFKNGTYEATTFVFYAKQPLLGPLHSQDVDGSIGTQSSLSALDALSQLNYTYIEHPELAIDAYLQAGFGMSIEAPARAEDAHVPLGARMITFLLEDSFYFDCVTPTLVEGIQKIERFCKAHKPDAIIRELAEFDKKINTTPRIYEGKKGPYLGVVRAA